MTESRTLWAFSERWFFAVMLLPCIIMTVLSATEILPHNSEKISPITFVLCGVFWIAAFVVDRIVSRPVKVSAEEWATLWALRTAEIKKRLRLRVSFGQAVSLLQKLDELDALSGSTCKGTPYFEKWYRAADTVDADLWIYDTSPEAWGELHGEGGFVLIRDGDVVDIMIEAMS
jgi:hypothetical protein